MGVYYKSFQITEVPLYLLFFSLHGIFHITRPDLGLVLKVEHFCRTPYLEYWSDTLPQGTHAVVQHRKRNVCTLQTLWSICLIFMIISKSVKVHSLTHGAEPFFGSRQLCSYSRTSQYFVEPADSLSTSHEPSTGPYP
jgi:hypothetical protein